MSGLWDYYWIPLKNDINSGENVYFTVKLTAVINNKQHNSIAEATTERGRYNVPISKGGWESDNNNTV